MPASSGTAGTRCTRASWRPSSTAPAGDAPGSARCPRASRRARGALGLGAPLLPRGGRPRVHAVRASRGGGVFPAGPGRARAPALDQGANGAGDRPPPGAPPCPEPARGVPADVRGARRGRAPGRKPRRRATTRRHRVVSVQCVHAARRLREGRRARRARGAHRQEPRGPRARGRRHRHARPRPLGRRAVPARRRSGEANDSARGPGVSVALRDRDTPGGVRSLGRRLGPGRSGRLRRGAAPRRRGPGHRHAPRPSAQHHLRLDRRRQGRSPARRGRGRASRSWSARLRCAAPPICPRCSSSSRGHSPRRTRPPDGPRRPSRCSRRPWPRPSRCDTASVTSSGRAAWPRPIWPPGASRTRSPWPSFTWRSRGRCTCAAPRRGLCACSPTWRSTAKSRMPRPRCRHSPPRSSSRKSSGCARWLARCRLTQAALDLAGGSPGDARRAATMALAQFRTLDMPRFAAQAEAMLRRS